MCASLYNAFRLYLWYEILTYTLCQSSKFAWNIVEAFLIPSLTLKKQRNQLNTVVEFTVRLI